MLRIAGSVCTTPNNVELPLELQFAVEVAQTLDASVWVLYFDGMYKFYQPRKGAEPIQDLMTIVGRKICDQQIPNHLKETVAFNHAAAIATLEKQFYIYKSPISGIEMAATVIPHEQSKLCVSLTRPLSTVVSYSD